MVELIDSSNSNFTKKSHMASFPNDGRNYLTTVKTILLLLFDTVRQPQAAEVCKGDDILCRSTVDRVPPESIRWRHVSPQT